MEKEVKHIGVSFIDIDRSKDFYFEDYNCLRIPVRGEVMKLVHLKGNVSTYYFGEVLFVIDKRQFWGDLDGNLSGDGSNGGNDFTDTPTRSQSISVIMREIKGEWGNETYNTLYNALYPEKPILHTPEELVEIIKKQGIKNNGTVH